MGICSKYIMEKARYGEKRIDWYKTGHGCYTILSHGFSYSHSSNKMNGA